MPNIGSTEIVVLLLVLVLLFGATRLPKAAEGIGKSLKVFKREIRSSADDDEVQNAQQVQNQQNAQNTTPAPQQNSQPLEQTNNAATADEAPITHQQKSN